MKNVINKILDFFPSDDSTERLITFIKEYNAVN